MPFPPKVRAGLQAARRMATRLFPGWSLAFAWGLLAQVIVIGLEASHLGIVLKTENELVDRLIRTRLALCSGPLSLLAGGLQRACPLEGRARQLPVLVAIDAETWRDPAWGGGEPVRAPGGPLAELVDRAFRLGASQVVLDVFAEDSGGPSARTLPGGGSLEPSLAQGLRRLMGRPYFDAGRSLVLARSLREPLPGDQAAFLPEMRGSAGIDPVVADSHGKIVVAAPYFEEAPDGQTRDWRLFSATCERLPADPLKGSIRIVPSVQLMAAAHALPARQAQGMRAQAVSGAGGPPVPCTPFPLTGRSGLTAAETEAARCELAAALGGSGRVAADRACVAAAQVCRSRFRLSTPEARACAVLDKAFAGPVQGVEQAYWQRFRDTFASVADPAAFSGDDPFRSRVVFSHGVGSALIIPALALGIEPAAPLPPLGDLLHGRVVVIGQTFEESGDFFNTPAGRMPGALVLSNAIDSLMSVGPLQASWPRRLAMALVFTLVMAAVFPMANRAHPGRAVPKLPGFLPKRLVAHLVARLVARRVARRVVRLVARLAAALHEAVRDALIGVAAAVFCIAVLPPRDWLAFILTTLGAAVGAILWRWVSGHQGDPDPGTAARPGPAHAGKGSEGALP